VDGSANRGKFAASFPKQSVGSPDGNGYWINPSPGIGRNNSLAA
jgi:hypothetical protein